MQVRTGAVKAFYSWTLRSPTEAVHDNATDEVNAGQTPWSLMHIAWSHEAVGHASAVPSDSTVSDASTGNLTALEATLYGALVGADEVPSEFDLLYVDAAFHRTANFLVLLAAGFFVAISNFP